MWERERVGLLMGGRSEKNHKHVINNKHLLNFIARQKWKRKSKSKRKNNNDVSNKMTTTTTSTTTTTTTTTKNVKQKQFGAVLSCMKHLFHNFLLYLHFPLFCASLCCKKFFDFSVNFPQQPAVSLWVFFFIFKKLLHLPLSFCLPLFTWWYSRNFYFFLYSRNQPVFFVNCTVHRCGLCYGLWHIIAVNFQQRGEFIASVCFALFHLGPIRILWNWEKSSGMMKESGNPTPK